MMMINQLRGIYTSQINLTSRNSSNNKALESYHAYIKLIQKIHVNEVIISFESLRPKSSHFLTFVHFPVSSTPKQIFGVKVVCGFFKIRIHEDLTSFDLAARQLRTNRHWLGIAAGSRIPWHWLPLAAQYFRIHKHWHWLATFHFGIQRNRRIGFTWIGAETIGYKREDGHCW